MIWIFASFAIMACILGTLFAMLVNGESLSETLSTFEEDWSIAILFLLMGGLFTVILFFLVTIIAGSIFNFKTLCLC
jgi:hypothetical protein